MSRKEKIIVFSAHSDDFVIGAGGTIANYTHKNNKVLAIVFSYGELSHPWLKQRVVQKMRSKETQEASKVLKCKSIFYDLREGKFAEDYKEKDLKAALLKIIEKQKPTKIFTHSHEDPHPDHRAVHEITLDLYNELQSKPEVYMYSIWNPVSFKTHYPSLYVNIRETFSLKLKALWKFKSQKVHVLYPFILLMYKSIKDGFKMRTTFGEHFFRIK
ncbi:MAG TPA: PIG-L deacetylase family protein [Candidatus Nanoarchaeia archaeon]|nr:PIG-L deacetylase family protein [Candidatus Nanoarchaeia archaeon]